MNTMRNGNGQSDSEVNRSIPLACADESHAVDYVEQLRWGADKEHGCPRCGSVKVYPMKDRKHPDQRNADHRWRCRDCGAFHTVRTGTVMEDSRIPLRHWCYAFWKVCSSKKGISALQIKRETGLTYKSALFLMHRIRFALSDMPGCKLTGKVEVDETYVGGKPRHGGPSSKRGRGTRKQPVMAMVQRQGEVRTRVIADVTAKTLKAAIVEHVHESARLNTDEFPSYRPIGRTWPGGHETVDHRHYEYCRGDAHTNTAESFFALLKRGIYGTFHAVSKRHLPKYVSEFEFRWNHRKMDDGSRVVAAVQAGEGKRLYYREPAVV
jgi:transposase-like protein